jgi:hypothetical protein
MVSSNVENDVSQTENDDHEKVNLTKTDILSIRNEKRKRLKIDRRQDRELSCDADCKFKGKKEAWDSETLGIGLEENVDSKELEAERRAEAKVDAWIALCHAKDKEDHAEKEKKKIEPVPKDETNPNQVRVTLTTRRDAQRRVTGTSSSLSLRVPANLGMNPPDLTALKNDDEEFILVKVSKKKGKCWATYLDDDQQSHEEIEREFPIGSTVSALLGRGIVPPQPPRLARVQLVVKLRKKTN